MWSPSFSTLELQFFASLKTPVTINPDFNLKEQIFLLSGKVGPWKAGIQTHVPLWLAIHLKQARKCKIYVPFWFQQSTLTALSEREKTTKNELTNLKNNEFFEISYIFLSKAPSDVAGSNHIRAMIQGIENMRKEKLRRLFEENHGSLKLKNLTSYEANRFKDPLSKLSIMVDKLKKPAKAND